MPATVSINGVDLTTFGFRTYRLPGRRNLPNRTLVTEQLHGRAGELVTGRKMVGRRIQVTGHVIGTSVADLEAKLDALLDHLDAGAAALTYLRSDPGIADRQIDGYLEGEPAVTMSDPESRQRIAEVTFTLRCEDAYYSAPAGIAVAITAVNTPVALPLGTAPSIPIVRCMAASPKITIRDAAGIAQVTLDLSTTVSANSWLDIDNVRRIIELVSSSGGTRTTKVADILAGGRFPFILDPAWGDIPNGIYPTAEVDAGTAEFLYWKQYR